MVNVSEFHNVQNGVESKMYVSIPNKIQNLLKQNGFQLFNEIGGYNGEFDVWVNPTSEMFVVPNTMNDELEYEVYLSEKDYENTNCVMYNENKLEGIVK